MPTGTLGRGALGVSPALRLRPRSARVPSAPWTRLPRTEGAEAGAGEGAGSLRPPARPRPPAGLAALCSGPVNKFLAERSAAARGEGVQPPGTAARRPPVRLGSRAQLRPRPHRPPRAPETWRAGGPRWRAVRGTAGAPPLTSLRRGGERRAP